MKIINQKVEHLLLQSVEPETGNPAKRESLLILGNAYGIMPYQVPLAEALAERGFEPSWFAFSGQEGTGGSLDAQSVLHDVSVALNHIRTKRPNKPLSVIAHCMGGLIALEYLGRHQEEQSRFRKAIVYGLLFNPARRWKRAVPKLKKSGVNVGFT